PVGRQGDDRRQVRADCHRGRLSPADRRRLRAVRGLRRLLCRDSHRGAVIPWIGGGGNSAGQAAVFLTKEVRKVYLVIRGDDLYKNMSSYLVERIEENPRIELLCNTEARRAFGDDYLKEVELINKKTGETRRLQTPAVFSFIGAAPRTDWLPPEIQKDEKGFIVTGPAAASSGLWTAQRQPFLLETSRPGVFAAGDVRSGSIKRVASAVGEGAMAVQFVHEYLKEMSRRFRASPLRREKHFFPGSHHGWRAGSRQSPLSDVQTPSYHT